MKFAVKRTKHLFISCSLFIWKNNPKNWGQLFIREVDTLQAQSVVFIAFLWQNKWPGESQCDRTIVNSRLIWTAFAWLKANNNINLIIGLFNEHTWA